MSSVRPFVLDKKLFNADLYRRIQSFWFVDVPQRATTPPPSASKRWWGIGVSEADKESFDSACRSAFLDAIESVGPEKYQLPPIGSAPDSASAIAAPFIPEITARESSQDDAEDSAASNALSLIILFDQLTRNIFRTPSGLCKVYNHYDLLSLSLLY